MRGSGRRRERPPAATVRDWGDRLDDAWPAIRSAVESDVRLDHVERTAALAIVDRLAPWFDERAPDE